MGQLIGYKSDLYSLLHVINSQSDFWIKIRIETHWFFTYI